MTPTPMTKPVRIGVSKEQEARRIESDGSGFIMLDDRTYWMYFRRPSWEHPAWVLGNICGTSPHDLRVRIAEHWKAIRKKACK